MGRGERSLVLSPDHTETNYPFHHGCKRSLVVALMWSDDETRGSLEMVLVSFLDHLVGLLVDTAILIFYSEHVIFSFCFQLH